MLRYEYNQELLRIIEDHSGGDVEFRLKLCQPDAGVEKAVKQIRDYYHDDLQTDILFHVHPSEEYQWIVHQESYVDFILRLFRHKLVTSVVWQ